MVNANLRFRFDLYLDLRLSAAYSDYNEDRDRCSAKQKLRSIWLLVKAGAG